MAGAQRSCRCESWAGHARADLQRHRRRCRHGARSARHLLGGCNAKLACETECGPNHRLFWLEWRGRLRHWRWSNSAPLRLLGAVAAAAGCDYLDVDCWAIFSQEVVEASTDRFGRLVPTGIPPRAASSGLAAVGLLSPPLGVCRAALPQVHIAFGEGDLWSQVRRCW